jgi:hypothetical protein
MGAGGVAWLCTHSNHCGGTGVAIVVGRGHVLLHPSWPRSSVRRAHRCSAQSGVRASEFWVDSIGHRTPWSYRRACECELLARMPSRSDVARTVDSRGREGTGRRHDQAPLICCSLGLLGRESREHLREPEEWANLLAWPPLRCLALPTAVESRTLARPCRCPAHDSGPTTPSVLIIQPISMMAISL